MCALACDGSDKHSATTHRALFTEFAFWKLQVLSGILLSLLSIDLCLGFRSHVPGDCGALSDALRIAAQLRQAGRVEATRCLEVDIPECAGPQENAESQQRFIKHIQDTGFSKSIEKAAREVHKFKVGVC
jgi:hypothetical protein